MRTVKRYPLVICVSYRSCHVQSLFTFSGSALGADMREPGRCQAAQHHRRRAQSCCCSTRWLDHRHFLRSKAADLVQMGIGYCSPAVASAEEACNCLHC